MEPPDSLINEESLPVDIARLELADSCVPAIAAAGSSTGTETFLRKIQAISGLAAKTIEGNPPEMAGVNTSLEDEVLQQTPHGVVDSRGNDAAAQSKATPESADDIVFSAAFPGPEVSRGMNPLIPGIKTNHDFTEGSRVPSTLGCWFQIKNGHSSQSLQITVRYSTIVRAGWYASRGPLLQQEFP